MRVADSGEEPRDGGGGGTSAHTLTERFLASMIDSSVTSVASDITLESRIVHIASSVTARVRLVAMTHN